MTDLWSSRLACVVGGSPGFAWITSKQGGNPRNTVRNVAAGPNPRPPPLIPAPLSACLSLDAQASFPQTMPAVSLSLSVSSSLPGFSPALYVAAWMLARQDTCGKQTVKATRPCSGANRTEQSHCDRHGHRGTPAGKSAWEGKYEVCWAQSSTQQTPNHRQKLT